MSDEAVKFGTLHPDGTVTDEREISKADIGACSFLIMVPEHYRADGTCRCDDQGHGEMVAWGYTWDEEAGRWVA